MDRSSYILIVLIMKYTSARVLPNGIPNRDIGFGSNGRGSSKWMTMAKSIPNYNALPYNNQMPVTGNNLAFAKPANGLLGNSNRDIYANIPYQNAIVSGNMAKANVNRNEILANNKISAMINKPVLTTIGVNTANNIYNSFPKGAKPKSVNLNFGYPFSNKNGIGKFGIEDIGIQVMADKLEVHGTVSVTGSMPFYGTVALNGKIPSEGKASVNYACEPPKSSKLR